MPFQGRGEAADRNVAGATQGLQTLVARKILPGLPELRDRLTTGGAVFEIGCGTGGLAIEPAKAFPAGRIVGVDVDADGLKIARRRIEEAGIGERAEVRLDVWSWHLVVRVCREPLGLCGP